MVSKAAQKRYDELKQSILQWRSASEIAKMYDEGYSPSQMLSLFHHQNSLFVQESAKNKSSIFAMRRQRQLEIFKRWFPYSKEQHKKHLSMPQWWKIRFQHLDKSEDEVRSLVDTQLQNWASSTHEKRRESDKPYHPKKRLAYWLETGLSREDAVAALLKYKRECSPFTIDFWIKKGYTYEQANAKTTAYHVKGGVAACCSLDNKFVSKLECRIFEELSNRLEYSLKQQHCIATKHVYDIVDVESRKIIEVNGTYWHADPRVYLDENAVLFNDVIVKVIRERDDAKLEHARQYGYNVLVVWEIDWHKNKEKQLRRMIDFLSG